MSRRPEAVVIGGGPAGATAALVLARAGRRVALVERSPFPRRKVCGEYISATTWPLLRELGVEDRVARAAGPPVRRVGLFAGEVAVDAPMPTPATSDAWGRAVAREHLDAALVAAAADAGAEVLQPWNAIGVSETGDGCRVSVEGRAGEVRELQARVVIAAHGSWERSDLPTQPPVRRHRAGDLLGFKAHFRHSRLPAGLMPLVLFPGGYGGMVNAGDGLTSFSCCVRRDALRRCRASHPGLAAGEALLMHVIESCRGVREALATARREGAWLSAGPIRPGVRAGPQGRIFVAGNVAGEAHPLVAEGISMAIQSGWLLARELTQVDWTEGAPLARARERYAAEWHAHFARRVRASSWFATLTTSRATAPASVAAMRAMPSLLTWGARFSGKAHALAGRRP